MSDFNSRQSAEILHSVHRNAEMAFHSCEDVLQICKNTRLHDEIAAERVRYRNVSSRAASELEKRGAKPAEYPEYTKLMAKMGIYLKTMNDRSASNIASMMIRGTTMGIIDMQHALNRSSKAEEEIRSSAQQLLEREEQFCDRLKRYL